MKPDELIEVQSIAVPSLQIEIGSLGISLKSMQIKILELIVGGESNKEIAGKICLSEQGVKYHVSILLKLFKVLNRVSLRNKIIRLKFSASATSV